MIAFIDDHRGIYGVVPICRLLSIAPSTYFEHVARRADPAKGAYFRPQHPFGRRERP